MAPVTLGTPTLETPRLILRPWREDDAATLFLHAKDPSVGPMAGWPPHTSVADSRRIIRDVLAIPETYAIVLKRFSEVDHPIGSIGLMLGSASSLGIADDEAEIGYWVGRIHWGHGYMPEAVREVMRHAFEDLGLSRIWCGYDEGNDKSRRVQEKVGLVPHHVIPDRERRLMGDVKTEYVTSISREGWRLAQSADPSDRATERAQREETADLIENIPLVARIRSGAQTGADRAGLDAARAAGIAICGWCPKGGLAEDMPEAPGVLVRYPELKESPSLGYIQRTAWNVRDSHATLVVSPDGVEPGGGTEATVRLAHAYGRPVLVVTSSSEVRKAVDWAHGLGRGITLNVAGPRSSKSPTVYDMTREVVAAILAQDALLPAPRSPLPAPRSPRRGITHPNGVRRRWRHRMSYFPVKVTKTTTYTMYVEADDEDQALDVAQERLEHKTADLVDYDTTDDFTIRASVENDEEYDVLETAHEAIEANLTYVVDANGDDVVNEDD